MPFPTPSDPPSNQSLADIVSKIEQENLIFANKQALNSLGLPTKILGRAEQMEKLVRLLLGYRQGHVVPFISIYGRSGSGKTTIVQHVIKELAEFDHIFVNLRSAGTIFAATNLILEKLGQDIVRGSNSAGSPAFDRINLAISQRLEKNPKRLFIMVLDEFDTIFNDPRGRPSDFIYKLIELGGDLSKKGLMFTVIGISNDVLAEYNIEDRVKSRIGTSEIFFAPYHHGNVLTILEERAKEAFALKIDNAVLERCAKLASEDHGDARRAIDLLRVAAESASSSGQPLNTYHVDWAARELHQDRLENILTDASYNFRRLLASLARITYLSKEEWHFTSIIVQQYKHVWQHNVPPLSYRRISEILNEMEGMGVVVSHATSRGRHGYGKQYKLEMSPDVVGKTLDVNWWNGIKKGVKLHANLVKSYKKAGAVTDVQKNRLAKNEALDAVEKHYDDFIWKDEDDDSDDPFANTGDS
ncbi:MAG TPA: AAA family ATPase [Candidatus Nitrosotalea sp.]|nr:AAA family ATPase [Candidatus Nitrosotalea sp.]